MTASHVAVAMAGGITSHDVPTTKSSTAPARPWNRCKVALSAVLLVTLAGLLALYVNVLNSVPAFVDESGDSTIEVRLGLVCSVVSLSELMEIFFPRQGVVRIN